MNATAKRALTPALNPTGIGAALAALYALVQAVWNATHHHAAIDPQVVLGALGAAAFFYARFKVTPVGDPRDGNGQPLKAAPVLLPPLPPLAHLPVLVEPTAAEPDGSPGL